MAQAFGVTRMRLERLGDERDRTNEKIQDLLALAEEEQRDLADYENEQITKYRTRVVELEDEILALATDIERANDSKDISKLVRADEEGDGGTENRALGNPEVEGDGVPVYRTFAQYAATRTSIRFPMIAERAAPNGRRQGVRRAGAGAARESTGQHALLERSRSGAATAHRADHGSHQRLTAGRQLRAATRPRQRDADLPEDRAAPRGSPAVLGEDRGWNEEPAGHAGDAHRPDVHRWRRHLLAGDELDQPGHPAVVVRPRCRGVRTGRPSRRLVRFSKTAAIGTVGTASGRLGTAGTESFGALAGCGHRGHLGHLHGNGGTGPHGHAVPVGQPLLPACRSRHRPDAAGLVCRRTSTSAP